MSKSTQGQPFRAEGDLRELPYFSNGVMCLNNKNELMTSCRRRPVLSLMCHFWPILLCIVICHSLNTITTYTLPANLSISCIVVLVLMEVSARYERRRTPKTSGSRKKSFVNDEEEMSKVDVAKCVVDIRYVKLIKKKWKFKVFVSIVGTDYQWRMWHSFEDMIYVHNQLRRDFEFCIDVTPQCRKRLKMSYSAEDYSISQFQNHTHSSKTKSMDEINAELRHMQVVIIGWLDFIREDPLIRNHIEFRRFLGLPKYCFSNRYGTDFEPISPKKKQNSTITAASPRNTVESESILQGSIPISDQCSRNISTTIFHKNSDTSPLDENKETPNVRLDSKKTKVSGSMTKGVKRFFRRRNSQKQKTRENGSVSDISSTTLDNTQIIKTSAHDSHNNSEPNGIQYTVTGSSWADVCFVDQTDKEKGFYEDSQYSHGFNVRGKTYGMDRKKVDSGPALCRLILLELYEVENDTSVPPAGTAHLYRHDHICSQGAVKARLEALQTIAEPPFVFVMNFQIPGDPPISIVSMFAVPPELNTPITADDTPDVQAHKRLWQAFIDMPSSEEERLAQCLKAEREAEEVASSSYFSGWKAPSDITWGTKDEPGVFPSTDFKNQRFKLVPTVIDGFDRFSLGCGELLGFWHKSGSVPEFRGHDGMYYVLRHVRFVPFSTHK